MSKFHILFNKFECLQHHDMTDQVIEMLNKLTPLVEAIFFELNQVNRSPRLLRRDLANFFVAIEPRGFLTCLGLRKTVASQDKELPPDKSMLI